MLTRNSIYSAIIHTTKVTFLNWVTCYAEEYELQHTKILKHFLQIDKGSSIFNGFVSFNLNNTTQGHIVNTNMSILLVTASLNT